MNIKRLMMICKEVFKILWTTTMGKVIIIILVAILLTGLLITPKIFGYVMAVISLIAIYMFSVQAQDENIISPKARELALQNINELNNEALFIKDHLSENPGDLEAKYMLRNIEEQIQQIKKEYNL